MMDIRSLSLTLFVTAAALVSGSCQKNSGTEEKETWPSLTEGLDGSSAYYGDYYGTGLGLFRVTISDSGLTYDISQDCYVGEGEILSVYLNTPLPSDANNAIIPAGEYSEGTGEYTFFNDGFHTSIVSEYDGTGNMEVKRVLAGTVTVKESVGIYWIKCDLLVDDEGEAVPFSREFVGKINVANNSEDGFISNLSGDVQCLPMNYAEFVYQDINSNAGSKTFSLFMATDYNEAEGSFDGDALLIYLNTGITDKSPADGTYSAVGEPFETADLLPGTFIPGSGTFESNDGTWFYSYNRQLYAQMKGGSIRITRNGDGTYGITAAFKDGNGHNVTASYNGEIEVY